MVTSSRPLLFLIILFIKRDWVWKIIIKLTFLQLFNNRLSKYLSFKKSYCVQWLFWIIQDEVSNFYNWIVCHHELFLKSIKDQTKISIDLYLRNYNHEKCISHEYTNSIYLWALWTLNYVDFILLSSIDTFLVYNWSLSNLKNLNFKFVKR